MQRSAAGHVDHVVLGVRDLDATAERLRRDFGFVAGDTQVVDGTGWANRGIVLGRGTYLELLTVHDPGTADGAALAALLRGGDRWLAWAVRLDDLGAVAARAGTSPVPGSRGGTPSPRWWTVQADPAHTTDGFLPFFVTYAPEALLPDPQHAGPAATVDGIAVLELTGPGPEPITEWLGALPPEVRVCDGPPGIRALEVRTGDGTIRLT